MPELIPLSLYIHLPWCVRKCPYCDFNSHALRGELPEADYLDALLADLEDEAERVEGRPVHTIFFGGGTPSLFSTAAIGRILDRAARDLSLTSDCEVTLEANPGASEYAKFAGFRDAGVNRISIGVQSFDPIRLKELGRIHDDQEAKAAIAAAQRAGFERINIDLMHGLPGQSPAAALADVEMALGFDTGHISHYQLTLEPNTAFHRDPPKLPDEDKLADIQEACHQRLVGAGYCQYEVSAWAHPGEECRHNLNYWTFGDYLGVGAGAHGKLTTTPGHIERRWKLRHPKDWASSSTTRVDGQARLPPETVDFEFMLNALRLRDGFTESLFYQRTGRDISVLNPKLNAARQRGLIENAADQWQPTDLGWRFLNDLQSIFLPGSP